MSFRLGACGFVVCRCDLRGALLPTLNANSRVATAHAAANGGPVGMFEAHGDVGKVLHPGTTEYDANRENLHDHRQRQQHVDD